MNDDWKDDALWDVLGGAKEATVSPYFSRRVLAAVRTARRPALPPLLLRWLAVGSLALLTAGFFWSLETEAGSTGEKTAFVEAFDRVSGIDSLVASGNFSVEDYSRGL